MKVSIITVTFNSALTLSNTIDSVRHQTYGNIEYIIVDGNSTDSTIEIIKNNLDLVSFWISEPDSGLYHAMNKGINLASGDIIGFINSDDFYLNDDVINNIVEEFTNNDVDAVHGELFYVDKINTDRIVRHWKSGNYYFGAFKRGWHPAHPTLFLKREVYEKFGHFNLDFKLASDFELMCRFFEKNQIKSVYLNKPLIKMRLGGTTSKNIRNVILQNIECYNAFGVNNLKVSFFYPILRFFFKWNQYKMK